MTEINGQPLVEFLRRNIPEVSFKENVPLANYTPVGIGGPAEIFCEPATNLLVGEIVIVCKQNNIPVTLLGWGANTLIADRGIAGVVIKSAASKWEVTGDTDKKEHDAMHPAVKPRYSTAEPGESGFTSIYYDESHEPPIAVTVDAGMALPVFIQQLLQNGITGLQWFSRIPATVGGAIYNNIHGGTRYMSDYVDAVEVLQPDGATTWLSNKACDFDYDYSRFHKTDEVILRVTFHLFKGDVTKAQGVIGEWARKKANQPQRSLGCVFQNITEKEQDRLHAPTPSTGYIIDKVLGLQGYRVGDAMVSDMHSAFIENKGNATAADYLAVMKKVVQTAKEKANLDLYSEIFFKGFTKEELAFLPKPQ